MSNIFSRISRLIAANFNGLLDKAEDPGLALQQVVREMNDELIIQRRQVAESIANYRLTEAEYKKYSSQAQQYNGYMIAYLQHGQEVQARQAATYRDECLSRAAALHNSAKIQAQNVETLTRNLQQLEAKCSEANNRKQELLVKASVAKSQEKLASSESVFSQFDRLEKLISVRSEQAIAYSEISSSRLITATGGNTGMALNGTPMAMPSLPPAAHSIPAMPAMPEMPAMSEMPPMPQSLSFN